MASCNATQSECHGRGRAANDIEGLAAQRALLPARIWHVGLRASFVQGLLHIGAPRRTSANTKILIIIGTVIEIYPAPKSTPNCTLAELDGLGG